jgi:hypothetical protein
MPRVFTFLLLLTATIQSSCTFYHYTQKSYKKAKREKPYDVIIVPGIPFEGNNTSSLMKVRMYWAKHLYDSGYTRNVIFSGAAVYTPYVEGIIMKVISDSLGIPSANTFAEIKAEHSTENVYYSWLMAKELGFKKIALATDRFQAVVLRWFVKKYCPGIKAIPVVFDKRYFDEMTLPPIDASNALVKNFVPIKKREGFFKRFRDTLGKRVKDMVKESKRKEKQLTGESSSNACTPF